ncbi:MarP family serine protease [Corynebacterium lubricantis]|uniref:MarP family serine protease n=1 Tax=Corynebacterium lubricantis TaxID=541095 RepID=UPI000379E96B|nr:MarP family serine protease [Corynebacterium lubricantis]
MTASLIIDAVIVLLIISAFVGGWRQGAFSSVLSAIGIIAGLVIGLAVAPFVIDLADTTVWRMLLMLLVIVLFVGIGNLAGATIGMHVRDRMRKASAQTLDSAVGAVLQALASALVIWLISIPLASSMPGSLGQGIRSSSVLTAIDEVAPQWAGRIPSQLAALLDESGLPPLVSPFEGSNAQEVDAPDAAAVDQTMVAAVEPSVVHVRGDAQVCERHLMGSGFVASPDYVITNAHVVAGTEKVGLDTRLGTQEATVVYYNPDVDIAVLHVPNLGLEPLQFAEQVASSGDDAVVMGYPESGPFEAAPARVRDRITIAGPDIYATGRVEREAYTVRGTIRQGNSGGPLMDTNGDVLGVVFGASVDSTGTGYALTSREVRDQMGDFTSLTQPVDTQQCVTR